MTALASIKGTLGASPAPQAKGTSRTPASESFRTLLGEALSVGEEAVKTPVAQARALSEQLLAGLHGSAESSSPQSSAAASTNLAQLNAGMPAAAAKALSLLASSSASPTAAAAQVKTAFSPRRRGRTAAATAESQDPAAQGASAQSASSGPSAPASSPQASGQGGLVGAAAARLSSPVARKVPDPDPNSSSTKSPREAVTTNATEKAAAAEDAKPAAATLVRSDLVQAPAAAALPALSVPAVARMATTDSAASLANALPAVPAGQEVQGAVLQSAAHLRVDTPDQGALELHLRIRDGAVQLRVDGDSARLVESRSSELSHSLAGQGLKLAPIETTTTQEQPGLRSGGEGGRQSEERREAWNEAQEARERGTSPAPTASSTPSATEAGIHVKA
ncbi:MAG TPA: hypothetical protein VLV17_05280 [Anaeromyxobacteraceae bacterium]|nr:hypothetical protein [Anaeromyxobacteraceae bacterium]